MNDEFLEAYIKCQKDRSELMIENERLKELCDKYEEEHKTTFKEWQDTIKRIDKATEYIKSGKTFDNENTRKAVEYLQNNLLDILKGSDKE